MTTFSKTLGNAKKKLSVFIRRFFKKKRTRIGIYGPPNAGKTTLANRIARDWTGDAVGPVSEIPHETRRARKKEDIIISGGENISSIEVERAIAAHPAVLECAVVSAPDSQWGEVPAAFVVVKPGHTLNESALCGFLLQRIAKFKMPRRFQIGDAALPKTGTGKIVKRQLRETFWSGKEKRVQG